MEAQPIQPSAIPTALQKLLDVVIEFLVKYSFSALGAMIVVGVGFWLGSQAARVTAKFLEAKIDLALGRFVATFVKFLVIGVAVIIALGFFGVTLTPFIAAIGGVAFGASLALQGPLSNYGAGLSIIMARPFTIGDTITVQGVSGIVEDVKLAATVLYNTEDGVRITIPNKNIVGEILQNSKKFRVAEQTIGIAYTDDPERAIGIIRHAVEAFEAVTKTPAPQIGIQAFADSAINIGIRYWIPTDQYFHTVYSINLAVYKAVKEAGLTIPYPQREVRVLNGSTAEAKSLS